MKRLVLGAPIAVLIIFALSPMTPASAGEARTPYGESLVALDTAALDSPRCGGEGQGYVPVVLHAPQLSGHQVQVEFLVHGDGEQTFGRALVDGTPETGTVWWDFLICEWEMYSGRFKVTASISCWDCDPNLRYSRSISTAFRVWPTDACRRVNRRYTGGVAMSRNAAVKQVRAGNRRPSLSRSAYNRYSVLDTDHDGTACERR